jgi:multidrug resistance efflux pump
VTRPGTVHSFQYADLYAKVSGFLQHQVVDIGDRVKKDQVLAEVFAPEIHANVQKAEADLKKARSLVEVMKARVQEAQADLREARMKLEQIRADLESAQALVKLRQEQYRRVKSLAERNAVEQELVDEKYEAWHAARASERATGKAVATAEAGVTAAEAALKRAQANVADAEAQVEVAQAVLAQARAVEEYTRIRAPFDGVITHRTYHEGDFIRDAAGGATKPVLVIARTDLMRVIVDVPDPDPIPAPASRPSSAWTRCRTTRSRGKSRAPPAPRTKARAPCAPRSTCPTPRTCWPSACSAASRSTWARPEPG